MSSSLNQRLNTVEQSLVALRTTVEQSIGPEGHLSRDVKGIADDMKLIAPARHAQELRLDRIEQWQKAVRKVILLVAAPAVGLIVLNVWELLKK